MTLRFLGAALALASLVSPTIAAAQVADRAGAPSGTAPLQAPCVVQDNGTCAAVKASVPLPTQDTDTVAVSSATLTNNGTFFSVDATGYRGISVLLNGASGQGTLSFEGSNDNGTTWNALQFMNVSSNQYTTSTQTTGATFYVPKLTKLVRARLTGYATGTWSVNAFLMQTNLDPGNVVVTGSVNVTNATGNVATGSTDSGNALKIGGKASDGPLPAVAAGQRQDGWFTRYGALMVGLGDVTTGNFVALLSSNSDTKSPAPYSVNVDANNRVWDRTANVWERMVIANDAVGTTGTGLLGVGNLGWDGAAWQRQRIAAGGGLLVADQDGLPVSVTPGTTSGNVLFSTTTNGFAGVSFQTGSAANGSTWNFQASNDSTDGANGNWFSINAQQVNGSPVTATQTANAGFFIPAVATYVRVILSGTVTAPTGGTAALRSIAPMPVNIGSQTINNNKSQWNTEANNVAVAAGAAAVGYTIRDTGQAGGDYRFNYFSCLAVPSTVSVGMVLRQLGSFDNSRFFTVRTDVVPSGTTTAQPLRTTERIFARYNRCQLDNSAGNAAVNIDVMSQYGE